MATELYKCPIDSTNDWLVYANGHAPDCKQCHGVRNAISNLTRYLPGHVRGGQKTQAQIDAMFATLGQPTDVLPSFRSDRFDALLNPDAYAGDAAPILPQSDEYKTARARRLSELEEHTASLLIGRHRVTGDIQVACDTAHGKYTTWKGRVSKLSMAGYETVVRMVSTLLAKPSARIVEDTIGEWIHSQGYEHVAPEVWFVPRSHPDWQAWNAEWERLQEHIA
jgi:hypothetical protein